MGADSQESMEQWMKSLACASYDYMKFMVADLQRQLKELEGIQILIITIVSYIFSFQNLSKIFIIHLYRITHSSISSSTK